MPPPKEKRKPSHLFYSCYAELCKKQNLAPLSIFKLSNSNQNKAVLDIAIDRIKYDEWNPILTALSHDNSLHFVALRCRQHAKQIAENIDTEIKVRQSATSNTSTRSSILTKYAMTLLLDAIVSLLGRTQFLTVLILEGLPMSLEFVTMLTRGLAKNKTLQHLNLQHCVIGDEGCDILARTLRYVSNVATLDLSHCNITVTGVEHLAELIKYQKISRYSESWKQTLRYREPDLDGMRGLRRLTLNSNEQIGDDGLATIIDVLQDDLWMKAIDVQNCGITENSACKINSLLAINGHIDIVDVRRNPGISLGTMQHIMMMLCKNSPMDNKFPWIDTATTLNSAIVSNINSTQVVLNGGVARNNGLVRSNSTLGLGKRISDSSVRKPRDVWTPVKIPAIVDNKPSVADQLKQAKAKIRELQLQLEDEVSKRQNVDALNVQLHSQLMEVMGGRSGGLGDASRHNTPDDCVSVNKEVLEEIYRTFTDLQQQFNGQKINGVNKQFQKLQRIIEESPPNSRGSSSNETRYSLSPVNNNMVNHTGDMKSRSSSGPTSCNLPNTAHDLFNALLSGGDDDDVDNNDYQYDSDDFIESARSAG